MIFLLPMNSLLHTSKTSILLAMVLLCDPAWCPAQTRTKAGRPPEASLLKLYPACPCYLVLGEGNGDTRIDARVNLKPGQRVGALLSVQLRDANDHAMQTESVTASQDGVIVVNLHVPVQAIATFRITASLLDAAGKEMATDATDIHVVPREESRVQLGPDGFLIVAGRRDFPIGLYSSAHYKEIGKAGITVTHNYGITTGAPELAINPNDVRLKELLDQSWANGMRMLVELPRQAVEKAQWAQVQRRIETFRHHPGLLCWDSEERVARGKAPLENIAALCQLVRKLDPDHPFVLGDSRDTTKNVEKDQRNLFPADDMDVGIWWWYPIPLRSTATVLEPPPWLTTTSTKKPLWIAIQAYTQPWAHSRHPTPPEYRAMAYLSIMHGVKGLFFYTGSGERDYHGKPAGLLDQPENSHWDYVQKLIQELHEATPVIMAPVSPVHLELTPPGAPVDFTVRVLGEKLYLLAASKSIRPQTLQFSGSVLNGRKAKVLYEAHDATINGNVLKDEFEPLGVHVYQIE